jgi:hypothetical protein
MKKLSRILTLWDGFWSLPLSFTAFLAFEDLGRLIFGVGFGSYCIHPSFRPRSSHPSS